MRRPPLFVVIALIGILLAAGIGFAWLRASQDVSHQQQQVDTTYHALLHSTKTR